MSAVKNDQKTQSMPDSLALCPAKPLLACSGRLYASATEPTPASGTSPTHRCHVNFGPRVFSVWKIAHGIMKAINAGSRIKGVSQQNSRRSWRFKLGPRPRSRVQGYKG